MTLQELIDKLERELQDNKEEQKELERKHLEKSVRCIYIDGQIQATQRIIVLLKEVDK